MSSQRLSAVDLLDSSEVSRGNGIAHAEKLTEIEKSLRELRSGRMIVIADDEDGENECDLVIAAELDQPPGLHPSGTYGHGNSHIGDHR